MIMFKTCAMVSTLLLAFASTYSQDLAKTHPPTIALRETNYNISPRGITLQVCMSIRDNGNFHLELRRQQLPESTATLHIYESSLNSLQLQKLRNILDSDAVKDLPAFKNFIPQVTAFTIFGAKIPRHEKEQYVGYVTWDKQAEMGKQDAVASISASLKEQWRASHTTLLPLSNWLHEIEGMNWPEVPSNHSNFCEVDSWE